MKPIVLLTDFGLQDTYAGVMKGVIARICPQACVIDLCHGVPKHDIGAGAFLLAASFAYFPEGTVFCAIVDPGVGTERAAIAVKTRRYYFVGPDNGLLSAAVAKDGMKKAVICTNRKLALPNVSCTFHGRDIFAPCAAYLANGVTLERFGPAVASIHRCAGMECTLRGSLLCAPIAYVDGFGNLITAIPNKESARFREGFVAQLNGRRIERFVSAYAEGREDEPFFIEGGFGYLEIALKNTSAREFFSLGSRRGAVRIRFSRRIRCKDR